MLLFCFKYFDKGMDIVQRTPVTAVGRREREILKQDRLPFVGKRGGSLLGHDLANDVSLYRGAMPRGNRLAVHNIPS